MKTISAGSKQQSVCNVTSTTNSSITKNNCSSCHDIEYVYCLENANHNSRTSLFEQICLPQLQPNLKYDAVNTRTRILNLLFLLGATKRFTFIIAML